jgi:hypothetical protein
VPTLTVMPPLSIARTATLDITNGIRVAAAVELPRGFLPNPASPPMWLAQGTVIPRQIGHPPHRSILECLLHEPACLGVAQHFERTNPLAHTFDDAPAPILGQLAHQFDAFSVRAAAEE